MMPFTWGRTSATRKAATRPGSSVVIGTGAAFSVTTETIGGGGGAGGGAGEHAETSKIVRNENQRISLESEIATSLRFTPTRRHRTLTSQYNRRRAARRCRRLRNSGFDRADPGERAERQRAAMERSKIDWESACPERRFRPRSRDPLRSVALKIAFFFPWRGHLNLSRITAIRTALAFLRDYQFPTLTSPPVAMPRKCHVPLARNELAVPKVSSMNWM